MNLSKSKYTLGKRCPKLLWLNEYKPEEADDSESEAVFENGNLVGDLARHLFGDEYVLIPFEDGLMNMIKETQEAIVKDEKIICEASFSYDGNFCSIDLLRRVKDGYEIYEVKSSTHINDIYIDDLSYQTWVLQKCGIPVVGSFLVTVNPYYVKNGSFDISKYFNITDATKMLRLDEVPEKVEKFKKILEGDEPKDDLTIGCHEPYDCPYFGYCTKELEHPNVFDVGWRCSFSKKLDFYHRGIISFADLFASHELNEKQERQVEFFLHHSEDLIDRDSIQKLVNQFTYPLYFLDFESYQEPIPKIDGTKPYQQICFQYSLHYYLEEGGELHHKEYLSRCYDGNPMEGLCRQLCLDIPMDSCVLVYNDSFEKTRLKEMASLFPEYREHLMNIHDHIIDLMPPFRNHQYYSKDMQGSFSIKYVLPALFPNDPTLDYHNLEQVHKGTEASDAFLSLGTLSQEEEENLRKNMLKYCGLDTYAMVKVYEKLLEIVSEKQYIKEKK